MTHEDDNTVILDISRRGALCYMFRAFLNAYERRTDVMARANATDPDEIAELTKRLVTPREKLEDAISEQSHSSSD